MQHHFRDSSAGRFSAAALEHRTEALVPDIVVEVVHHVGDFFLRGHHRRQELDRDYGPVDKVPGQVGQKVFVAGKVRTFYFVINLSWLIIAQALKLVSWSPNDLKVHFFFSK